MLQTIGLGSISLSQYAYFYDKLNNQLIFLKDGQLVSHHLKSKQQRLIHFHASSAPSTHPTPNTLTLISGQVVANAHKNIVSLSSEEAVVRGRVQIVDGSRWEWQAPISLQKIKLGICHIGDNEQVKYQLFDFNSSTSRTVSFSVHHNQLSVLVNGYPLTKNSTKTISYDSKHNKWYPCAKLQEKGNTIIYAPLTFNKNISNSDKYKMIFGSQSEGESSQEDVALNERAKYKIVKLVQLNRDSFLVIWQNNVARLFSRSQRSGKFEFTPISVHSNTVHDIFTPEEYSLIAKWKGQTIDNAPAISLSKAFKLLKSLLKALCQQESSNQEILFLLASRLAILRPYLLAANIVVPDVTLLLDSVKQAVEQHLSLDPSFLPFPSIRSALQYHLEGAFLDISQSYLVTRSENTIILYNTSYAITEIFRHTVDQKLLFSKRSTAQSYEEDDIRSLKSQGSFLYKILSGCLQKGKKTEEVHAVNENDVKELVRDYGIDEKSARQALEQTGHVEEALVWIFTDKQQGKVKRNQSQKEIESHNVTSVNIIELNNIFARVLLQVGNRLFVLGVLPSEVRKWYYKGQKQYIDLLTFKHEDDIKSLNWKWWYCGPRHPHLHILDQTELPQVPRLLYKQGQDIYWVGDKQQGLVHSKISLNYDLLYEPQESLTLSQASPLSVAAQKIGKTIKGQLVNQSKVGSSEFQSDTVWTNEHQLYSNIEENSQRVATISLKDDLPPQIPSPPSKAIPFIIESSPPGCSSNYSVTSMLHPKSSFLANYPSKIILRHLHNKLINLSAINLHRSSHKKNVNYITEGQILLLDAFGNESKSVHFSFDKHENEKEVKVQISGYWKNIVLVPKFTEIKKLPYQYGFISLKGNDITSHQYDHQHVQTLTSLLHGKINRPLTIVGWMRKANHIQARIKHQGQLEQAELARLAQELNYRCEAVASAAEIEQNRQIAFSKPSQIIKLLCPPSIHIESTLRRISSSALFNFTSFSKVEVFKFIDLALYYTGSLVNLDEYFSNIFTKLFNNQFGKEYLIELSKHLDAFPTIPLPYLKRILQQVDTPQHISTIQSLLQILPNTRISKYDNLQSKYSHLIFQTEFYSDYYLNLIEGTTTAKALIFSEPLIDSEFIAVKDQYSRRIIVKLDSIYHITNLALRVQRCEQASKVKYGVYALSQSGKRQIGSGVILEHQWAQISREIYKQNSQNTEDLKLLNMYGLVVQPTTTQYLQIELHFTQTGIVSHQSEASRIPQVDVIPELYGHSTHQTSKVQQYQNWFVFNPEEMFFLSVSSLGINPLHKYSVSKGKQTECLYFKTQRDDPSSYKARIQEKIERGQLDSIVNLQKKLISCTKTHTNKICLDYVYTVLILSLNELQKRQVRLEQSICKKLFELIVASTQGPIKIAAFKAISKQTSLLIKSLQYVQQIFPTLGKLTFSYQQLLQVVDLNNAELCQSLTRLILTAVHYEPRWAQLLIKMSGRTQAHEEIVKFFSSNDHWLDNNAILEYVSAFPDQFFQNTFLNCISYSQLSRLVTKKTSKPRLELLLEVIVEKASEANQVDLDVVGLIFQQPEVRWEQLQKVVTCCPQAIDTVIHHFLQAEDPSIALEHYQLLNTAATNPKYSQEFAIFINKIYLKSKQAFRDVILSMIGKCTTLHYDCLQTISQFVFSSCNFGGIEGVKLLGELQLYNLQVAVQSLRILEKVPEGAEICNEDSFIEWYLNNNDYEQSNRNPANKSPAYHLMRQLVDLVQNILKATSPSKVLAKYSHLIHQLQHSRKTSLFRKHLLFNQLHHGATELLAHTLAPGCLAEVLVGPTNPVLSTVINQLKSTTLKEGSHRHKSFNEKEIDITQKFQLKAVQAKDLQGGKVGSRSPIAKVPISQRILKLESEETQWPSKFIIGFCLNDHLDNKNAILPSKVQLFGGNGKALFKVGDLKIIEDQFYMSFGVKVFAINFNTISSLGSSSLKNLQLRLFEPSLSSASEILQNGQRSRKGATYNISFVNINGYDSLPSEEPDYSQLYVTLLGFLGHPKYLSDLRKVISSDLFDQKLELIIQVLNDLLPNQSIENLLLSLNKEGQNILQHILRSKGANSRLVSRLILGKLTKDNINKLLTYTLNNLTQQYVNIVTMSIRLGSYSSTDKHPLKAISDFNNIQKLIEKYEQSQANTKRLYYSIIVSLLTVPNLYHYEVSKLIGLVWNRGKRSELYSILAAILPYYQRQIEVFTSNDYSTAVLNQLLQILQQNKNGEQVIKNPYNQIILLNTLTASQTSRNLLLSMKAPIKIVELLKSNKSLLINYSPQIMKLFISFFQATCIRTACQDQFSQILINLMTSLNNFDSIHHQFFIQNFFFPLINSFKGVPLFFVWREKTEYVWQPTQVLKSNPIRSSSKVISYKDKFYTPIEALTQVSAKSNFILAQKQSNHIKYILKDNELTDADTSKKVVFNFADNKLTTKVGEQSTVLFPSQQYTLYEQSQWEHQLLTNTTLINLQNPWILQDKYRGVLPIRESTNERCYFLPLQITLSEILKSINISGFRVHHEDLPNIKISNYLTGKQLSQELTLRKVLQEQHLPYLKIQLQASSLFKSTTIESLVVEQSAHPSFVPEETIFKAFEEKKGLEKLIGVLTGCVVNWTNKDQSKIWEQYLKELQSYSCFPIFSSLYMTKKDNVNLLFDLLFGLPDKQDSKKWSQKEKQSVKELYGIVKDVFAVEGQQALTVRNYALKSGFYSTMLNRLHLITKEPKRQKLEEVKEEEEEIQAPTSLEKKESEEEYKAKLQKRKGVGYGTDSSTNQKWDVTGQEQARKDQSEQILSLLTILEKFLDYKGFDFPQKILEETYASSLLPIIENSLRGGSLLQISKYAQLIQGELSFIQVLAKHKKLIPTLLPLPKNYEPRQPESLHSLLKTLANTSKIFLSCLTGSASEKVSEEIAKKITATFQQVDEAVAEYEIAHNDEEEDRKILELPLAKKYPILLKDLRFDYIDMKDSNGKISKHHYSSYYQAGHKSPVQKTVRLAQQLADVSHALPIDHTNAIFVRCDKERVDYMQALIMGSNGTPYGHGAYLFDIYFEDTYPNGPPKVNLTTTGNGQIRFNPNLYSCGKVCLSLLGTWRGSAMENWDSKVSTLLQVLVSIQSIIMSEDIYFNEPGFEHEQGTVEGEKKNEAYANIVRYGNVKFAMTENIKNPPKGFETIIRRHFYLKKAEILQQCQKWLKAAQKRQASYNGLVSDHNYNWCNTFKKSKTQYKTMLQKAIKELQVELNKLPPPTSQDLKKESSPVKQKKKVKPENITTKEEPLFDQIDVSYGQTRENVELDINDEKVKDRWSRYIGAMGVEAVSKQSKANILLLGLGGLGVQIAKNIVLSGCKQFAVWDDKEVRWEDLSGQFFLGDADIGKSRLQSTIYKLQELNHYVKVSKFQYEITNIENMGKFNVVIATQVSHQDQEKIDQFCRNNKIHFVSADCFGPYGQIFNDFGEEFEILDKNGEQTTEIILEDISISQKGLVRVAKGLRHPFEDGETVRISGVKGMRSTDQKQSINGTLHKVQVVDQYSFYIGSTLTYTPYEGDGTVRNIKTPIKLKFKSLRESVQLQNIDSNLQYYDFSKGGNLRLLHHAFLALSHFRTSKKRTPESWNRQDANEFIEQVKKVKSELTEDQLKYLRLFSYTCSGNFGPIFALYGGIVSQEVFKAITGKYTPINQYFLADFSEVVEQPPQEQDKWAAFVEARKSSNDRREGIKRVIGNQLLTKLQNSKVFMVGSGAIGCQLLKNFAMLEIGTGENGGSIVVTDPDHIETSNLNRQFLFREKHLRKPKSATAAAVVTQMNPRLKGHIKARLDKVCESTKDLFSNEFFQGLSIVTNALDNVQARRYVDSRCVENKVALLESGTLSSKGHVQVIIPYKTQTYGSKQDPNDANGEVPHCTLKMFPEETLHCIEWARDLFGKEFTLSPKALAKLLESESTFVPGPSDIQMLKDCLKMLQSRPTNFEEAAGNAAKVFYQLFRNDILQLLYTYPLDAKTKDGKLFWRLPKRPPTQITQIDPKDPLHATFISSYAVLLSKIHGIPYPKDFRDPLKRKEIAQISIQFKVEPFVPSDKVAKEMTEEVNNQNEKKEQPAKENEKELAEGENELFCKFKQVLSELKEGGEALTSKAEEFEKDEDQNGHIDLIYSMANLRARNYKLDEMEWINVKLKAGRIMPALSTTTSCIAALQTIELVKYIKGCKVDQMRNAFINLAVPLLQLGEPGEVQKIKVHENLQTSIWERWEVSSSKEATLRDLIGQIEQKYGVLVKGLNLCDGGQVFSDIVLGLQSKKEEKEKLLSKKLRQILVEELEAETVKFIDFTLLMSVNEELVKHAPTLRLTLQ